MLPTHQQALERLAELSRLLDNATLDIAELDEQAIQAKTEYEVAYARAFVTAEGSMDLRKQLATIHTHEQHLTSELAAVKYRACKERIRTLNTQIEVGRSLASAHKTQYTAEPVGQYT